MHIYHKLLWQFPLEGQCGGQNDENVVDGASMGALEWLKCGRKTNRQPLLLENVLAASRLKIENDRKCPFFPSKAVRLTQYVVVTFLLSTSIGWTTLPSYLFVFPPNVEFFEHITCFSFQFAGWLVVTWLNWPHICVDPHVEWRKFQEVDT